MKVTVALILFAAGGMVGYSHAATCPFDGGGSDAVNDGLVLTRYALGITGAPLVASTRYASLDPLQVKNNIECVGCALDMNGDGQINTVDTTIIARHLAGFTGTSLTNGLALGSAPGASRPDTASITSFLASGCAVGGAINAFVQGGNSFGAPAVLGTNDAQNLTVKSGGSQASFLVGPGSGLRITTPGGTTFPDMPAVTNGSSANLASARGATVGGGGDIANDCGDGVSVQFRPCANKANGQAATVSGGMGNVADGLNATIGGGYLNSVLGNNSVVSGGQQNLAEGVASVVGGGSNNVALGDGLTIAGGTKNFAGSSGSFVGGGFRNIAEGVGAVVAGGGFDANFCRSLATGSYLNPATASCGNHALGAASVISGGQANRIDSAFGVISGGGSNAIRANQNPGFSSIGGGSENVIDVDGSYGVIPGGSRNFVGAKGGFAAGERAKVFHDNSFVWNSFPLSDAASTAIGEFRVNSMNLDTSFASSLMRAGGLGYTFLSLSSALVRVRVGSSSSVNTVCDLTPGSGGWNCANSSDRNLKHGITRLSSSVSLQKALSLPITQWSYNGSSSKHIGPMAQDFQRIFKLSDNNTMISASDMGGIAISAIQGLNQKLVEQVKQKDTEIARLKARADSFEREMAAIKKRLGI
jgi:hypothetical protein